MGHYSVDDMVIDHRNRINLPLMAVQLEQRRINDARIMRISSELAAGAGENKRHWNTI